MKDLDGITLACTKAAIKSILASEADLTPSQRAKANIIYSLSCELQQDIVWGIHEKES